MGQATMGAGHFIYIPCVLMLGVVIGWILASRAARDAYAAELRRRADAEARRKKATGTSQT
jgi:hypothetical protein